VLRIDPVLAPLRRTGVWAAVRRSRWWQALLRGPVRSLYRVWLLLRRAWRRNLQLRVVSITLALSGLLVGSFGVLVSVSITDGLLGDKQKDAHRDVTAAAEYAIQQLQVGDPNDPALRKYVGEVLTRLASEQSGGSRAEVAIVPHGQLSVTEDAAPDRVGTLDVIKSAELERLRAGVQAGDIMFQYVTANPDGDGMRPFLVYATRISIPAGTFGLYYLFPLDAEVVTADRVTYTVTVTGFTLVLLLAVLAALVTRMVVRPVRLAARTAQRLSAGLLDQRMEVRGEDDLARLAASFNQMAANLQRQIIRLEEMSRLQRRFTSDVSHELRTPLTTVRMAADLIFSSRDEFEPATARSAEILQGELDRFESLLTDLLEISRFDAGFAVLDAEPTDLVAVVGRVADRLESLAERCGSALEVDVPDIPVIVEVDPRRVERILRNLVGNAVEHGEGAPVRVTVRADESAVAVTVRDHGIGLKPGEEKLVFNRFWRADPSRARQTGGTGLGLSISVEDARLHGGWLEAWGAPGQGAQFRLALPIRAGDRLVSAPLPLVPDDVAIPIDGAARTEVAS
jgi:two-component system, OmpR family, sensor histidine kinase MtrB